MDGFVTTCCLKFHVFMICNLLSQPYEVLKTVEKVQYRDVPVPQPYNVEKIVQVPVYVPVQAQQHQTVSI